MDWFGGESVGRLGTISSDPDVEPKLDGGLPTISSVIWGELWLSFLLFRLPDPEWDRLQKGWLAGRATWVIVWNAPNEPSAEEAGEAVAASLSWSIFSWGVTGLGDGVPGSVFTTTLGTYAGETVLLATGIETGRLGGGLYVGVRTTGLMCGTCTRGMTVGVGGVCWWSPLGLRCINGSVLSK